MTKKPAPKVKAKPKKKHAGGRPRTVIDVVELEKLAAIGCTHAEIADWLYVSKRTLEYWLASEDLCTVKNAETGKPEQLTLRAIADRGYARMRISIRREQLKLLMAGNATMAVWLGKQVLGQKDHIEQEVKIEGGTPRITLEELLSTYRKAGK
jgi:hypothetical protein